jgi:hypothetical protein
MGTNPEGDTPLHGIAFHEQLEVIPQKLLTLQNLTINNNKNKTPIYWAAQEGGLSNIHYTVLSKLNKEKLEFTLVQKEALNTALKTTKEKFRKEIKQKITNKLQK